MLTPILALAIPSALVVQVQPADVPPVFSKLAFAEAVKETTGTEKVLVAKATASWCPPCKQMDRTTWRDEKVVAWFKENGLAVQFDVDADQALAQSLKIEAMPTMIAFRNGKEFDRIVGFRSADDLLAWTTGVKRGEKSIEAVRSQARAGQGAGEAEIQTRYDLAGALVNQGELDKATDEYLWLWRNTEGTSFTGVRGSFMASDMQRLAQRHPPAMTQFSTLRDDVAKRLTEEKMDYSDLDDWIVLNGVVSQEDATLAWFDQHKGEARWRPFIRRASFRLEALLDAKERWSDLGALYPNPLRRIEEAEQMKSMMTARLRGDAEQNAMMKEYADTHFRDAAAKVYIAMLHAGREDDARAVAARAVRADDTPEMRTALVQWAVRTGQPRPEQMALLDQAGDAANAGLRKELQEALEKK